MSFSVVQVDNPDLIASKVRILDTEGQPSTLGRLDIMDMEGNFIPVCNENLEHNKINAVKVCQVMG